MSLENDSQQRQPTRGGGWMNKAIDLMVHVLNGKHDDACHTSVLYCAQTEMAYTQVWKTVTINT